MRYRLCGAALTALLAGCAGHDPAPMPAAPVAAPISKSDGVPGDPPAQGSTPVENPAIINVVMYQFRMPLGSVSHNAAFWKLVDEDAVDVGTYNLLYGNGLRIGQARVADWPEFKAVLDRDTTILASRTIFRSQSGIGDALLDMSEPMGEETLFMFDRHGLTGRSYDDCRNEFSFAFEWEPGHANTVRVTICPVVQVSRTRFDYSLTDDPSEEENIGRENLYALHLRADLTPGEFLVIGPSPAAKEPNRVGNKFLDRDGPNQRYEQILVVVGQPVILDHVKIPRASATRPAVRMSVSP